jgi:hypothetical protein
MFVITQILTHLPFNLILRGLKFEIEKIRGLYAKRRRFSHAQFLLLLLLLLALQTHLQRRAKM